MSCFQLPSITYKCQYPVQWFWYYYKWNACASNQCVCHNKSPQKMFVCNVLKGHVCVSLWQVFCTIFWNANFPHNDVLKVSDESLTEFSTVSICLFSSLVNPLSSLLTTLADWHLPLCSWMRFMTGMLNQALPLTKNVRNLSLVKMCLILWINIKDDDVLEWLIVTGFGFLSLSLFVIISTVFSIFLKWGQQKE